MNPQCKYLLYGGAGSGGKSYWLRWSALGFLLYLTQKYQIRGLEVGLFSEDYPTLKDRQISKIAKEFPSWLGELKESQQDGYAFRLRDEYGGGLIKLRNLDDPSKYASAEFAGVFVEELTKNPETTFEDLRFRMRWPGISEVKFAGATNPGQIGHGWCKRKWVKLPYDERDQDVEQARFFYVPATAADNKYISKDYIRQLEALPPKKRKMLLEGSWDEPEGQFFEEWNERLHVCRPFIPKIGTLIVGGLDWGRVKPFSFHLSTVDRVEYDEQTFYRSRTFLEVYGTGKTPGEWAEIIVRRLADFNLKLEDVNRVMCDTQIFVPGIDNSIAIVDQFIHVDTGFHVFKAASKDRLGGWENLHNWLSIAPDGLPYWQISSSCPNLVRTLPEMVYDTVHQGKLEDVNTEGEDHAADDQRYEKKSLKWIDAHVGAIRMKEIEKRKSTAVIDPATGKQFSLDTNKIAELNKKGTFYKW